MAETVLKIKTTMNQSTIAADTVGYQGSDGKLGKKNTASLQSAFASSPIYSSTEIKIAGEESIKLDANNPDSYRAWFFKNVVKGVVNDKSFGLGQYDRDFGDAPNLFEVETGGEGLPATAFSPNPTSPGEGSGDNASAIAPASDAFIKSLHGKEAPFSGLGSASQANLADSANKIVDAQS